ncbi:MAG: transporter substrate-binding domain-containing protein [Campylobacterota bacterium]|nr:transporter substrate-binding domain-containing protein [Campylobacterota bacterium]
MKSDGSFDKIYAKWLPLETPPGIFQMMTEEYPPITFMKDGKPSGFVTEMVQEIALRLHIPDNIRLTSWKNAYNMALLHPNIILFSAERTPEREELFRWVGPVGKNSTIFYAKKGSGIQLNSLEEAKQVEAIATTTDWFSEQYLKRERFTNLVSSEDPVDNVRQLMNGEVDLSIFTDLTVPQIVKNAGYSMDDLEPIYTVIQTYFYIALSKDTCQEEQQAWQSALDTLKEDGTFEEIYQRYLLDTDLERM